MLQGPRSRPNGHESSKRMKDKHVHTNIYPLFTQGICSPTPAHKKPFTLLWQPGSQSYAVPCLALTYTLQIISGLAYNTCTIHCIRVYT